MSYTWIFTNGDFVPEYRYNGEYGVIEVMKVGGGSVGRAYDGAWLYRIYAPNTDKIVFQDEFSIGVPVTHKLVAEKVDETAMALL